MGSIPQTSGIYKITCNVNQMIYVGSSINLRKRCGTHFALLRRNQHYNRYLQHAYNKYGEDCFTFEVLELVMPWCLVEREGYWFKKLRPFGEQGFNVARTADAPMTGRHHSNETLEKMSTSQTGRHHTAETRAKMSAAQKGIPKSPEAIAKVALANRGNHPSIETRQKLSDAQKRRAPASAETRAKLSAAKKGKLASDSMRLKKSLEWIVISPDGIESHIVNLTQFCREQHLDQGSMVKVAGGRQSHCHGWKCRRA